MYYYSEYESPVGKLTIASDGAAVCGLWLEGQKYHGGTVPEAMARNDVIGSHQMSPIPIEDI